MSIIFKMWSVILQSTWLVVGHLKVVHIKGQLSIVAASGPRDPASNPGVDQYIIEFKLII